MDMHQWCNREPSLSQVSSTTRRQPRKRAVVEARSRRSPGSYCCPDYVGAGAYQGPAAPKFPPAAAALLGGAAAPSLVPAAPQLHPPRRALVRSIRAPSDVLSWVASRRHRYRPVRPSRNSCDRSQWAILYQPVQGSWQYCVCPPCCPRSWATTWPAAPQRSSPSIWRWSMFWYPPVG